MERVTAIFQGSAWVSERGKLPRKRDELEDAYMEDPTWQQYLQNRPENLHITAIFDDSERFRIRESRKPEHVFVTVHVPSDEFRFGADPKEVMASVVNRVYTWVAEKYGWPPPPDVIPG